MKNILVKKLSIYFLTISIILFIFSSVFAASTTPKAPKAAITDLPAPAMIVATAGASQINLIWSPVTGATYYNVYESLDGLIYNLISVPTTLTTESFDVTGLTNGKLYYFKTSAANSATESTYSNVTSEKLREIPKQH